MISDEEFSYFDLNQNRLDEEWLSQPRMFIKCSSDLAEAKSELDRAVADREFVVAELDHHIRAKPNEFAVAKVTDKAVEKAILLQKRYHEASQMELDAKKRVYELQAVVTALDHRKKALEKLVELWSQAYWSTPKAPKGEQERLEELGKRQTNERIRKTLNR